MQDKIRLSLLLDYYGAFLTDNQREMLTMSANEDYSLSEIAEQKGVSKQAVRDAIVRGERQLYEMESKLGLAERDMRALAVIDRLTDMIAGGGANRIEGERINTLLIELKEILEGKDGV